MMRTLLMNDHLVPRETPDAYLEVVDPFQRKGCIKVFDAGRKAERYIEMEHIKAELYTGELTLIRNGQPLLSHAAQSENEELHEQSRFVRSLMRKIEDLQKQENISFRQAYCYVAEEYQSNASAESLPFPTQSTIYRYRKAMKAGLPILRGDKNKGNRQPRYPQEVTSIICHVATQHYLTEQSRWSLKRMTTEVNSRVHGTIVPKDSPPVSSKFVHKIILRFLSADPEHARMLSKDAIAGKSIARKRIRADYPFERVEQDAVHLPFVVQTPSGVSSQVYLVHAIDCCTSYPVGWHLCVGAPRDTDTLACIEMYMTPIKKERLREMGIDHDRETCGTMGEWIVDNGTEVKGPVLRGVERLGVDVKHCRARAGQEKPFIERLNRSLKEALEGLTGCTRMNGKDGARDPEALGDPLMTLAELEIWIVRWYYERWIHTPLERLVWDAVLTRLPQGNTPDARWQYFEDTYQVISVPPSRAEWLAAMFEHADRQLSRKTGITIEGLHYKGKELAPLIEKYGEQQPVHILFNPHDYRCVYVYEGDDQPVITLNHEHLRPESPAWSFKEIKEQLKTQKAAVPLAAQAQQFDQDLHARVVADSLAPKRKKPSKYDRNRETARQEKAAQAIARAAQQATPLQPPTNTPQSLPTTMPALPTNPFDDEVQPLPVLDRIHGGRLS